MKSLLEKQLDQLQKDVRRLQRMQPDPITIIADDDSQLVLGTQDDGSFGLKIWDSNGALQHSMLV